MSAETEASSREALDGLSYADILRELSALYQIKPQDVSAALNEIKGYQPEDGRAQFENGVFRLDISKIDSQQQITIVFNRSPYTFDVIPYRGKVNSGNELASFHTLRMVEETHSPKSVPTVRPSARCQVASVAVNPFVATVGEGENPYGVSPSEAGFLADEGSASQKRHLGFKDDLDTFQEQALALIDKDE